MPDDLYAFDEAAMRRIADAVRWVERHARDLPASDPAPHPPGTFWRLAESYEAIPRNGTGKIKFRVGAVKGSETLTNETFDCFNRLNSLPAGRKAWVAYIQGGWEIMIPLPAECADLSNPTEVDGYQEGKTLLLEFGPDGCWHFAEGGGDCP